jgi:uncharacterized membrane protein YdbT with pleckstrin-like domain
MPSEQMLWEGSPSTKTLALDLVATPLFAAALGVAVYLAYHPVLRFVAGISRQIGRAVAAHESGLRLAAFMFVIVVVGARIVRLVWRLLALRANHYRLSNQRLLIESGLLSKTIVEIDLRTIDEIIFHQSFGERLLGVGQIAIASSEPDLGRAGSRRPGMSARLVGIRNPRVVREQLRNAAYEATGNQLFMRST